MSWPDEDPYTAKEKKVMEEIAQELEELHIKVNNFLRILAGKLN